MVKEKKSSPTKARNILLRNIIYLLIGSFIGLIVLSSSVIYYFETSYKDKIYPGVRIDGISFGGKTPQEVENFFDQKSEPLAKLEFTLTFEDKIATLSGNELSVAFDGKLSSTQGYSIGRSGHFFSDAYQKWRAATVGINLSSVLKMNTDLIDETLNILSASIDIPASDALFQFESGKVNLFRPSVTGRRVEKEKTKKMLLSYITKIAGEEGVSPSAIDIALPVETVFPQITTEGSNTFGIKELVGVGKSKFVGSIPGRVHNIELAASRINGRLIPPGAVLSFNDALGDVSASTGFQPAYIIKEGRTVLGDGGGVCQVSTTLFRAALNTGLPIVERHAHSYRVGYYEQDSSPGVDATVYAPSYDLKFKNDSPNYLLIQAKTDRQNSTLTFEIYGTNDGRQVEITKPVIWAQSPPPPDLYQDDPTLPKGVVKQVDWKAWGAKTNFDYKVTRNGEVITQKSFYSNFQPWQAVFLRGTRE